MQNRTGSNICGNRLLASLSAASLTRIAPKLEPVSLEDGATIHSVHQPLNAVYFPVSALVSFANSDGEQRTAAVALAGNESLVGVGLVLGNETSIHDVVALQGGLAWRLPRPAARAIFVEQEFRGVALRFAHAFLTQISFTAVCERLHTVEQRLIRWLLLATDRVSEGDLSWTQDVMARLIGARREAITLAAGNLQRAGLIQYRRGKVAVVDRARLDEMACQCYCEIRTEYARLFRDTHPETRGQI